MSEHICIDHFPILVTTPGSQQVYRFDCRMDALRFAQQIDMFGSNDSSAITAGWYPTVDEITEIGLEALLVKEDVDIASARIKRREGLV
jgi:hypothetical protein